MTKTEYLHVYAVRKFKNEQTGEKGSQWTKIGAAFPNSKGGFAIELDLMPMDRSLDIVAMPPREREGE